MRDWAGLQNDVLFEIGKRLTSIESYDSFGAVCRSWRAGATRDKQHLRLKTFERWCFILPKFSGKRRRESPNPSEMLGFYCVLAGKTRKIFLPEVSNKLYISCMKNWIFIVEKDGIHTSLLHLVSRVQIHLPIFPCTLIDLHAQDVDVVSANPNSEDEFIVAALVGNELYVYKSGYTSWTASNKLNIYRPCPMIYHNNYVYALGEHDRILRLDVNGPNPNPTPLQHTIPPVNSIRYVYKATYMVEFSKNILIVRRYKHYPHLSGAFTRRCAVYELNTEDGKSKEITNLGNKAIFLSNNISYVVECSEINNCKPNCIYFVDHLYNRYNRRTIDIIDMAIYNLSDGCFVE